MILRPEKRNKLVARKLARHKVDIAALSLTRLSEQGQLEVVVGYTFFMSGCLKADRREASVTFVIKNNSVGRLLCLPQDSNDRLMKPRLLLREVKCVTIISAYVSPPPLPHPVISSDEMIS
ncbi:unnamed protein product [Schistocephalus solidus]|uniref:LysR_substrate domain-containing protein n=1 Tax=Schistocephalus solidus TaxID=70667 RepID=A0A183TH39_SCHSO|nr:unnamed protein product [Schistocephalus solidus]